MLSFTMDNMDRFTNDDWDFTATLTDDAVVVDLSGATITAGIVTDCGGILIAAVTPTEIGSWSTGVVEVAIPLADTGITFIGTAYLEIQVVLGGKTKTYGRQPFDIINDGI